MARFTLAVVVVALSCACAFAQKLILPGKVDIEKLKSYQHSNGYATFRATGCTKSSLKTASASNDGECRSVCNKDPRCAAVTFNSSKKRCYLKRSCGETEREPKETNMSFLKKGYTPLTDAENEAYASWLVAEEIKAKEAAMVPDYLNKDGKYSYTGEYEIVENFGCLRRTIERTFADDFNGCKGVCNSDMRCGAFTYNTNTTRCFLKPSCVPYERQNKKDNRSAIKKKFEKPTPEALEKFLAGLAGEEEIPTRPAGTYKFSAGKRCKPSWPKAFLSGKPAQALKDCRTQCDELLACKHYSYRATTKVCRLFSGCPLVNDREWFTGSRTN